MDDPIRHPLAYARLQRGWSQGDLAREIRKAAAVRGLRSGVDRQRVWKWEHNSVVPDDDSQILLSDVLQVPEALVLELGWPGWLPGWEDPLPFGSAYTVQALREAHRSAMDRRTFMTVSTGSLVGLAAQWALLEPDRLTSALDGKSVDGELVDWLEATSARLTSLPTEQRQHTAVLLNASLVTVTDLLKAGRYNDPTGLRLHNLAASLAVTCGWYRFDQSQHASAGRYWDAALRSAHAAGNRDLGAGVLSDFAYQAMWLRDANTSVGLLEHALSRTSHPTARSLLHLRKARAHATFGNAPACHRDLFAAERELEVGAADPAPGWCAWMSPADLAVDSGQCFLDLGRPKEANERISEGIALLPRARDKTRAVFLTYEARGFLKRGDVEQAVAVTNESLDLAQRIGAERCVTLVRAMAPAFRQYKGVDGVPDFLERLRAS